MRLALLFACLAALSLPGSALSQSTDAARADGKETARELLETARGSASAPVDANRLPNYDPSGVQGLETLADDPDRITVRAISTDGGPSRHFPNYTVENGQRPRMGLEPGITPAVVLWDSETRRPIPIGYGVLSADELQDRIYLLTTREAGHDY